MAAPGAPVRVFAVRHLRCRGGPLQEVLDLRAGIPARKSSYIRTNARRGCGTCCCCCCCFSSSTGCNHANSHGGTSADCSGYAVPTYPYGHRASPLETFPSNSHVEGSGNRRRQRLTEEQLAKKKLTDRKSQKRRVGKM